VKVGGVAGWGCSSSPRGETSDRRESRKKVGQCAEKMGPERKTILTYVGKGERKKEWQREGSDKGMTGKGKNRGRTILAGAWT